MITVLDTTGLATQYESRTERKTSAIKLQKHRILETLIIKEHTSARWRLRCPLPFYGTSKHSLSDYLITLVAREVDIIFVFESTWADQGTMSGCCQWQTFHTQKNKFRSNKHKLGTFHTQQSKIRQNETQDGMRDKMGVRLLLLSLLSIYLKQA